MPRRHYGDETARLWAILGSAVGERCTKDSAALSNSYTPRLGNLNNTRAGFAVSMVYAIAFQNSQFDVGRASLNKLSFIIRSYYKK